MRAEKEAEAAAAAEAARVQAALTARATPAAGYVADGGQAAALSGLKETGEKLRSAFSDLRRDFRASETRREVEETREDRTRETRRLDDADDARESSRLGAADRLGERGSVRERFGVHDEKSEQTFTRAAFESATRAYQQASARSAVVGEREAA